MAHRENVRLTEPFLDLGDRYGTSRAALHPEQREIVNHLALPFVLLQTSSFSSAASAILPRHNRWLCSIKRAEEDGQGAGIMSTDRSPLSAFGSQLV
jgi:hypothetical protein